MEHQATWLAMQGANYPALYLESAQWPGEIRTRKEIIEGQLLLHVPRAALISLEDAKTSAIGKKIAAQGVELSDFGYLALFLLDARHTGGPHQAYANSLLLAPPLHPLLGGDPVLQQLKGCAAATLLLEHRKKLIDDYRTLQSCWQEETPLALEEFAPLYCTAMVHSNIHRIDKKQVLALIPLTKMPLHSFTPNAHVGKEASYGAILIASAPIAAEQTILICRGQQSNSALFARYGIQPDTNPYDEVEIDFPAPTPAHPLHAMLEKLGHINEGWQYFKLTRNLEDDKMCNLLSFLRLVCLEDMPAIMRIMTSNAAVNRIPFISEKNEAGAWKLLDAACARALERYEQNDVDLSAETHTDKQRLALLQAARQISKGEQGILTEYREKCVPITAQSADASAIGA